LEQQDARKELAPRQLAALGRLGPPPHPSPAMLVQFAAETLPADERPAGPSHLEEQPRSQA